jgi:hypothetical protein
MVAGAGSDTIFSPAGTIALCTALLMCLTMLSVHFKHVECIHVHVRGSRHTLVT